MDILDKKCTVMLLALYVVILNDMSDGLKCNMDQCVTYNEGTEMYQGKRAVVINGTLEGVCGKGAAISLKSIKDQGSLVELAVNLDNSTAWISYKLKDLSYYITHDIFDDVKFGLKSKNIEIVIFQYIDDSTTWVRKIYYDIDNISHHSSQQSTLTEGLFKYNQTFANKQFVEIYPPECSKNLSLSFCSCEEPVITNMSHVNNTIRCEASGYPVDALTVSFFTDAADPTYSVEKLERNTELDTIEMVAELRSMIEATTYTCYVYNNKTKKSTIQTRVLVDSDKAGTMIKYAVPVCIVLLVIICAVGIYVVLVYKYHLNLGSVFSKLRDQFISLTEKLKGSGEGVVDSERQIDYGRVQSDDAGESAEQEAGVMSTTSGSGTVPDIASTNTATTTTML